MEYIDSTYFRSKPQIDVRAETLAGLADDRRALIGRYVRYGETEMIVDSVSDIGHGWWRLRLIPPSTD